MISHYDVEKLSTCAIAGAADAFHTEAWLTLCSGLGPEDERSSERRALELRPPVTDLATQFARDFLQKLTYANGLHEIGDLAKVILQASSVRYHDEVGSERLGYLLAMASMGHGVFWGQDAGQRFPIGFNKDVSTEFYYDEDIDHVFSSIRSWRPDPKFKVGYLVRFQWHDGEWYDGTVTRVRLVDIPDDSVEWGTLGKAWVYTVLTAKGEKNPDEERLETLYDYLQRIVVEANHDRHQEAMMLGGPPLQNEHTVEWLAGRMRNGYFD